MKTLIKSLLLIFLLFITLIQKTYSKENIKIGLIVPLSGEYKEIGNSIIKSTRLAINKINNNNIIIFPKDNKATQK